MTTTRKTPAASRTAPRKKATTAKVRLLAAIQRYAEINGRAQWLNGYRAGSPAKEAELHGEEMRRWTMTGAAEIAMRRALTAYVRALNQFQGKRD